MKFSPRLLCLPLCLSFCLSAMGAAEPKPLSPVDTTPKLEILNKQIEMNAEDSQAYVNRAYTLALLGRKDEARADLKKALVLKDNAPMQNRVGWAYFNLGDYDDAVHAFETSVKVSGYRGHYDYYSLVLGYWGTGQTKLALENYQLAVERDPRFGEFKTLDERTAEWTPLERRAIHEIYVLWSKTWKAN
ncbi:MAG TPA: tetratricopeptide repeat protein [Chthoniobacter sp.]|nr:tetratricopeptide repeat protein [Chthoniobacter sp.]